MLLLLDLRYKDKKNFRNGQGSHCIYALYLFGIIPKGAEH